MPKGKRHTPEQIVAILRRSESGETIAIVCRETNISTATFHRWKSQDGGMDLSEPRIVSAFRSQFPPNYLPGICQRHPFRLNSLALVLSRCLF